MVKLIMTLFIAAVGGLAAKRLRLPAGAMTGAMITVMVFGLLTNQSYFPTEYKMYVQFFSGALVGAKITAKDIAGIRKMLFPCLIQIFSMLMLNMIFGLLMHFAGGLDVPTAFFSSAPAGMSDMALIAADYGANTLYVSIIQMFRIVCIVSFMPTFYKYIIKRKHDVHEVRHEETAAEAGNTGTPKDSLYRLGQFVVTAVAACAGGYIFKLWGVKSGALIGAIVTVAVLSIFTKQAYMPSSVKTATQICAGAYVGALMNMEALLLLPNLLVPTLIMLLGMFVFVYFAGALMHKVSHLDWLTSLLISTPGGVQEMSLMAQEFECDSTKVALMHVVRIMAVIFMFPGLIGWLETVL